MASSVHVPSTFDQIFSLARYQLRDYLRSRRFVLIIAIYAAIGLILTALIGYYRPAGLVDDALAFYSSLWGGGFGIITLFAVAIFGGDAIAGEFQNKTGYFLMGLPIRRSVVYVGKYLAALAASLAAVVFFFVIIVANGVYYLGGNAFPWELGASFLLALGYLLAAMGATFLFSSMFKVSAYPIIVVVILFLFGFTLLETAVSGLAKVEPWFVLSYAQSVVQNVFINPYPPHVQQVPLGGPDAPTITLYTATIPEGVGLMIAYFLITSIVGLVLFEREEFS